MTLTAPKGGDDITKSGPKSKANAANTHQATPPITNSAVFRGLQLAQEAIGRESDSLDREIQNLKTEFELRRELSNNAPWFVLKRQLEHGAGSEGVYQGDPIRNRLIELQQQKSGGANP